MEGGIHFAGILGSGCYPLAQLLRARGYTVSGTDSAAASDFYQDSHGIRIWRGATLPAGTKLLVYSLAIDSGDAVITEAQARGIPLVSRAQLLGALMSAYRVRVSVSGSHGKSTTTAIIQHVLQCASVRHTAISGATLSTGAVYTDGGGEVFVTEACEYKDSFLSLCPTHQIITSVELDHTDYFPTIEDIRRSFLTAARRCHTLIINLDDPVSADIVAELKGESQHINCEQRGQHTDTASRLKSDTPIGYSPKNGAASTPHVITYGTRADADYTIENVRHSGERVTFCLNHGSDSFVLVTPLIGDFNLYNVAAATVLALELGIGRESIAAAVASFYGIERRLSLIAHVGAIPVYYDYAHHPREISAVIGALKERWGTLTVIFRPHTYSRTAALFADFASALSQADRVILLDVFPAREAAVPGVSSQHLAECTSGAVYCPDQSDAARLATEVPTGAIALLGAGEVERVRADLIEFAKKRIYPKGDKNGNHNC